MGLKAVTHQFVTNPVSGVAPTVVGNLPIWDTTDGKVIGDSGIAASNLGLLNANQTWTGLNSFETFIESSCL